MKNTDPIEHELFVRSAYLVGQVSGLAMELTGAPSIVDRLEKTISALKTVGDLKILIRTAFQMVIDDIDKSNSIGRN